MRRFTTAAALYLAAWTGTLVLFSARLAALFTLNDEPMRWSDALASSAVDWLPWIVFTPPIIWLARRIPRNPGDWRLAIPVHVVTAIGLTIVHAAARPALAVAFGMATQKTLALRFLILVQFDVMMYAVIVGIVLAFQYSRHLRAEERRAAAAAVRAAELERTVTESRLSLLRAQMDPHFLFNTLHGISAQMHEDVRAADLMLTRLSALLRASIDDAPRHEVSLEDELDFADRYLGIQHARLGDRLRSDIRIRSDVLGAQVPSMLLQPLIENAIRHGIEPRAGGGTVEIEAFADGAMLRLFIRDDGAGIRDVESLDSASGIGLRNTTLRLRHLYGVAGDLAVRRRSGQGTEVAVTLPLKFEEILPIRDEESLIAAGA